MNAPALAEAVTRLPWVSPGAGTLAVLARAPAPAAWEAVRLDPGAVLLVVRQAAAAHGEAPYFPALLRDPAVPDGAARLLGETPAGFVDWNAPAARPVYRASLALAHTARRLAERTGRADPDRAWVAGLLAPLGWLAVCAVDPDRAAACLADPEAARDPAGAEARCWGLDQGAIIRRLCRRWNLPRWLAAVAGHLDLAADVGPLPGADADLFRLVQLAAGLVRRQGAQPCVAVGAAPAACARALGLSEVELGELERDLAAGPGPPEAPAAWAAPQGEPLLRDLLLLAAENRRLAESPALEAAEADADHLHQALRAQQAGEEARLRALQLGALAELAAGAGHEINNPLAVISGQAQYLLTREDEPGRQRALEKIIAQAQRIHGILSELMQFARPPRPQTQAVDAGRLVADVAAGLAELAAQRRVRLVCPPPEPVALYADPRQARTALACLLRNAVEAAPADGWAGVRLEPAADRVDLVVEDSGPGPGPAQREHLFDPFYSGRQAGRGRGLGLPTAWRLAREHGGDVRFEPTPGGPTRFVLTLPRAAGSNGHAPEADGVPAGLQLADPPAA